MKRTTTLLISCLACANASAALISSHGYVLDTTTNIVTGGGLEWLQWDEAAGLVMDDVTDPGSSYYQDGWRVASRTQMAGLYNDWGFGGVTWQAEGERYQTANLGYSNPGYVESAKSFIDLFGSTYDTTVDDPNWSETGYWAIAKYGVDDNGNSLYDWAAISTDKTTSNGLQYPAKAELFQDHVDDTIITNKYSVALVRVAEVPEPTPLVLLGLGAIGFVLRRRMNC